MNHKYILIAGTLTLLLVFITGCGNAAPAATVTPTRTPKPAATPVPPTALPTETPLPPTATPTEAAAPAQAVTPFPPGVNPLTGLEVADPEMLEHIPLAIKISNSPAVRPQSGLNSADIIFEHYAEGNITRFTGIFYGTFPKRVGSVRSGRLIDLEIPAMYQGIFAFSGMSGGVKQRFRASDLFPDQVASPDFGIGQPYFYRVPEEGKAFEHTLYVDPVELRALTADRGVDGSPEFPQLMSFAAAPPALKDMFEVSYFEINYLVGTCTAEWSYDAASGNWLRQTVGEIHRDYLTGEQVHASNVAIIFANHLETDIWEEMLGDQSNWKHSLQIQVWGTGSALLFRDGKMYQGYWKRQEREDMLTFQDTSGNPLPLKPGNSWFQLVPANTPAEEFETGMYRFTP
ncbi:MAG: DUF3048 domain-containing protein [Chloroflexota bacterium]|nr:DUF3048 domain-containing protein [Chloroflexota bacterium]